MRIAVTFALAVLYVGVTLAWGGVPPRGDQPWWVLAPFVVTFVAGVVQHRVSSAVPAPWAQGRGLRGPPRRVRLSWRTVFHVPVYLPMLVLVGTVYWVSSLHLDVRWALYVLLLLGALALLRAGRRLARELRLLREGEVALGVVDAVSPLDGADRIVYRFTTAAGETLAARGWDLGYGAVVGSVVPVYHAPGNPADHVVACGSCLEAE
jgi:hypothetical protein